MPKTAAFEKYCDAYDEWFERNPAAYRAELEAVRQLLPPSPSRGLEIGIGTGKFAGSLGIETGVEPSRAMASRARRLGINVVHGVAERLPFIDDDFDMVLMVTTICFVDDVVETLGEAFRVLKPGGCLIVGFVDGESELGRRYREKRGESRFYQDAVFYSAEEVVDHLERAGFGIAGIRQTLVPGEPPETILNGFGKGSFLVIKGMKDSPTEEREETSP